MLLSIDGLIVRTTASLQEAQAWIGTHGGVHLVTWETEEANKRINKGVSTFAN